MTSPADAPPAPSGLWDLPVLSRLSGVAAPHLETPADAAAFFVEPVTTHHRGWDALVAGVAVLAARGRPGAVLSRAPSSCAGARCCWPPATCRRCERLVGRR